MLIQKSSQIIKKVLKNKVLLKIEHIEYSNNNKQCWKTIVKQNEDIIEETDFDYNIVSANKIFNVLRQKYTKE